MSVLGYREDGEWVALALELDLRGYGESFEQAQDELAELVTAQFSFAAFKEQPELIWHPAEPRYWRMYEETKRARIQSASLGSPAASLHQVSGIPAPPAHVIAKLATARRVEA